MNVVVWHHHSRVVIIREEGYQLNPTVVFPCNKATDSRVSTHSSASALDFAMNLCSITDSELQMLTFYQSTLDFNHPLSNLFNYAFLSFYVYVYPTGTTLASSLTQTIFTFHVLNIRLLLTLRIQQ